jgi:hypothetical protein
MSDEEMTPGLPENPGENEPTATPDEQPRVQAPPSHNPLLAHPFHTRGVASAVGERTRLKPNVDVKHSADQ